MKIVSCDIKPWSIPLRISFAHSKHTHRMSKGALVILKTESQKSFVGEMQVRSYLTGETLDSATHYIQSQMIPRIKGANLNSKEILRDILQELYEKADSDRYLGAYCAVEWAILEAYRSAQKKEMQDAIAEILEISAPKKPHVHPRQMGPIPLTGALGLFTLAGFMRLLGNSYLKVKADTENLAHLTSRLAILRHMTHRIGLDGNGGIRASEWLRYATQLRHVPLAFVEQPTDKDEENSWRQIAQATQAYVVADESICTRADGIRLIDSQACDGWNLRLAKVGGFFGLKHLHHLGSSRGYKIHLGALVGESIILEKAFYCAQKLFDFDILEPPRSRLLLSRQPTARF